jgi:hypothetical protein
VGHGVAVGIGDADGVAGVIVEVAGERVGGVGPFEAVAGGVISFVWCGDVTSDRSPHFVKSGESTLTKPSQITLMVLPLASVTLTVLPASS